MIPLLYPGVTFRVMSLSSINVTTTVSILLISKIKKEKLVTPASLILRTEVYQKVEIWLFRNLKVIFA